MTCGEKMGNRSTIFSKRCGCSEQDSFDDTSLNKLHELLAAHHANIPVNHHETCLRASILYGDVNMLKTVLHRGVNPNIKW